MNIKSEILNNLNKATFIMSTESYREVLMKDTRKSANIIRDYYTLLLQIQEENLNNIFIDGKYLKTILGYEPELDLERYFNNTKSAFDDICKLTFIAMKCCDEISNVTFFNSTYKFLYEDVEKYDRMTSLNRTLNQDEFNKNLIQFISDNQEVYDIHIESAENILKKTTSNKSLMDKIFKNGSNNIESIIDSFLESLLSYEPIVVKKYYDVIHNLIQSDILRYIDILFLKERLEYLLDYNVETDAEKYRIAQDDTKVDTTIKIVLELSALLIFIKKINTNNLGVELDQSLSQEEINKRKQIVGEQFTGTTAQLIKHIFDIDSACFDFTIIQNKQKEIIKKVLE